MVGDHENHRHQSELRQQREVGVAGKLGEQRSIVDEIEIGAAVQTQSLVDRIKLCIAIREIGRHRRVSQQNAEQQDEQHLSCRFSDRTQMRIRPAVTIENTCRHKPGDRQRQPRIAAQIDAKTCQREADDCHGRHCADQAPDEHRARESHRRPLPCFAALCSACA